MLVKTNIKLKQQIEFELRNYFRPEFINRLDDQIVFEPLDLGQVESIVGMMLDKVASRLKEQSIRLEFTPEVTRYIAEKGYNPSYGARPLKRYIQKNLESPIAREIVSHQDATISSLKVSIKQDQMLIESVTN